MISIIYVIHISTQLCPCNIKLSLLDNIYMIELHYYVYNHYSYYYYMRSRFFTLHLNRSLIDQITVESMSFGRRHKN